MSSAAVSPCADSMARCKGVLPSDRLILQLYETMRAHITYPCDLRYSDVSWDCPRGDEAVKSQILWSQSSRHDGYSKCISTVNFLLSEVAGTVLQRVLIRFIACIDLLREQ